MDSYLLAHKGSIGEDFTPGKLFESSFQKSPQENPNQKLQENSRKQAPNSFKSSRNCTKLCKRLWDGVIVDKRSIKILCDGGGDASNFGSNGRKKEEEKFLKSCEVEWFCMYGRMGWNTQEQANILWEIVEQVKAKQPLDGDLDLACKYATRIQELLVYVQDTCPNAITPSTKKVESSNTSDSNTLVLSSTEVKCSTSNCGSKPPGNKTNDRISQTPSRNKKNKVEAQPRKVNKMNCVVKPVCDVDVKQSLSNANSDILCATCNKSMFDGVHDKCLLDLVQNGNNRTKSAKKHKKQNI
ncbi:hypothetical protein Tco_0080308 [Tanacetum coccineum]